MNASSSLRTTVSTCPLPRGWHLRALGAERRAVRGAGLLRLRRAAREVVPERAVRAKGAEHQVLVQDLLACLSACHAHVRAQHTGDRVGHRGWVNNTAGARRSPTTPCWPVLGRASLRRTGPPLCQRQGYRVWRPGLAWCKTMHDLADAGQHAPPRPPEGGTRSAQSGAWRARSACGSRRFCALQRNGPCVARARSFVPRVPAGQGGPRKPHAHATRYYDACA